MASETITGLVLQGGGALGAYELGAARRLYKDGSFAPDVIAGVSIGAITAVLLARPKGGSPIAALEEFWRLVTVQDFFALPGTQGYGSLLGNPRFFVWRHDLINAPNWTYLYDTGPLAATLRGLVDTEALADPAARPRLLVSATDIVAGEIEYFDSEKHSLTIDHILASGSLPPSFPATTIGKTAYWDGGLFDNTPLGAVIDRLAPKADVRRVVYVVNLFPNKGPLPLTMPAVLTRMSNLQFANRTAQDLKLMERFNEVAALMDALAALPPSHPVFEDAAVRVAYEAARERHYVAVPDIVPITQPEQVEGIGGSDFSPETIARRAAEGYRMAEKALASAAAKQAMREASAGLTSKVEGSDE
jgi:predicted acylesterase/phospholipase RssA